MKLFERPAIKKYLPALAALLAGLALFPALRAGFTNGDECAYVLENPLARSLAPRNLLAIFSTPVLGAYTPLAQLSFAFDYALSGAHPAWYHAVNLLLHMGNAALAALLLMRLLKKPAAAFLAAALFAVHPLNAEAVAWIAGRGDLLGAFFFLLSALAYLEWRGGSGERMRNRSLLLLLLALLARPAAGVLPLALLCLDWIQGRKIDRAAVAEKWPWLALAAPFAVLAVLLGSQTGGQLRLSPPQHLAAPFYALWFYTSKLAFPAGLAAVHSLPRGGAAAMAAGGLLFCAITWLLLARFGKDRAASGGLAFFAAALLPSLQIIVSGNAVVAERWCYLPGLGLFLALAAIWAGAMERYKGQNIMRGFLTGFPPAIVLVLMLAAQARASVWKDSIALWTDSVRKQPSPAAFTNLGNAWLDSGRAAFAAEWFSAALALDPASPGALMGRGNCESEKGDFDAALADYRAASAADPRNPYAHANISKILFLRENSRGALEEITLALQLLPGQPQFLNAKAGYLVALGEYGPARALLEQSYQGFPDRDTAAQLCALYCAMGNCAAGQRYCARR